MVERNNLDLNFRENNIEFSSSLSIFFKKLQWVLAELGNFLAFFKTQDELSERKIMSHTSILTAVISINRIQCYLPGNNTETRMHPWFCYLLPAWLWANCAPLRASVLSLLPPRRLMGHQWETICENNWKTEKALWTALCLFIYKTSCQSSRKMWNSVLSGSLFFLKKDRSKPWKPQVENKGSNSTRNLESATLLGHLILALRSGQQEGDAPFEMERVSNVDCSCDILKLFSTDTFTLSLEGVWKTLRPPNHLCFCLCSINQKKVINHIPLRLFKCSLWLCFSTFNSMASGGIKCFGCVCTSLPPFLMKIIFLCWRINNFAC